MPKFNAQEAFAGTAIGFGPNYPSIEIVLEQPALLKTDRDALVLSGPLGTNLEIDQAIDAFKRDLESIRIAAKQRLKAYIERAQSNVRQV